MNQFIQSRLIFLSLIILIFCNTSCTSTKKVIYFNNLQDSTAASIKNAQSVFENTIQKNDQLSIVVGGSNALDLIALNSGGGSGGLGSNPAAASVVLGYLVEADGKIQVPYIGKVKAEGLTRLQLQDTLTEMFKDYTKNPVVNVRFLNYSFSVLGEVGHSGRFSMINERTTILEAISMAGDITYLGKLDNVSIIREVNGERKFARVNLLSKDIFNSPYFYLKTNDVVYVEPVKARYISRNGVPQYLSIIAIGLSLVLTIINLKK